LYIFEIKGFVLGKVANLASSSEWGRQSCLAAAFQAASRLKAGCTVENPSLKSQASVA
jgi:hypothetical protein